MKLSNFQVQRDVDLSPVMSDIVRKVKNVLSKDNPVNYKSNEHWKGNVWVRSIIENDSEKFIVVLDNGDVEQIEDIERIVVHGKERSYLDLEYRPHTNTLVVWWSKFAKKSVCYQAKEKPAKKAVEHKREHVPQLDWGCYVWSD